MEYVYYIVSSMMRWDSLAYFAYGDAGKMADLLDANQEIGVYEWIPEGVTVKCPILLDAAINPLLADLPSWKKN